MDMITDRLHETDSAMASNALDLICTIGPATFDPAVLTRLIDLGVSRFRLPFSKEPIDTQRIRVERIYEAAKGRPVTILMDLPGSKARLDNMAPVNVQKGQRFRICFSSSSASGGPTAAIGLTSFHAAAEIAAGAVVVTGDGELSFEVLEVDSTGMDTVAVQSGILGPARGVAFLDSVDTQFVCLTERDQASLEFLNTGLVQGLMLSFVECAADVLHARRLCASHTAAHLQVYAKLETRKGISQMEEIAETADFLLLARGDLLLNLGLAAFCAAEWNFLQTSIAAERLVVGTQLFNSLSDNALPNRAELTAFHLFLRSGISRFLLSTETTVGNAPVHTVETMSQLYRSLRN